MQRSYHSIANEVRMKRTQFDGTFLIVEGATDARFLKRFLDTENCRIVVANDKETAMQALAVLEQGQINGVAALVDADFDRVTKVNFGGPNIITPHVNDLDLLLFLSPALEKVISEFGSQPKLDQLGSDPIQAVRALVLNVASEIGCLRYISFVHELNLRFKELSLSRFLDRSLEIDHDELISEVRNHSRRHDLNLGYLKEKSKEVKNLGLENHQLCNGHDVMEVLAYGLRSWIGNSDPRIVTREMVECYFRLAFEEEWFRESTLANSIWDWELRNSPFRITGIERPTSMPSFS